MCILLVVYYNVSPSRWAMARILSVIMSFSAFIVRRSRSRRRRYRHMRMYSTKPNGINTADTMLSHLRSKGRVCALTDMMG